MRIGLEEHMSTPRHEELWDSTGEADRNGFDFMKDVENRLQNVPLRLEEMKKFGMDHMILSLTSPGAQALTDTGLAVEFAKESNDFLVEHYTSKHPKEFTAFATVATQDPQKAADELDRAVTKLGMKGAMINGYCNIGDKVAYLDEPQYEVFWNKVNELNVPIYLHPREPIFGSGRRMYDGYPSLIGSAWGFAVETAIHAVRLMMSGLFDRYPNLNIILGHLGEGVTFLLPRCQHRLWMQRNGSGLGANKRPLTEYFKENFYLTTSGHFHSNALDNAIAEVGVERVMLSVDYPYEYMQSAFGWWENDVKLPADQRALIEGGNAQKLFNL